MKRLGSFIIESKIIMDKSFLFLFAVSKLWHVSDRNRPTAKAPQTHPTEPTGTGTAAKGISKPQSIQSVFSSTRKHWIQRIRRIGARRTGNCRQLSIFARLYFVVDVLVCLSVVVFFAWTGLSFGCARGKYCKNTLRIKIILAGLLGVEANWS